jgi:hypothetical protein
MADVVNTAAVTFSGGQSHCGGVAVARCGEPAAGTPEGSPREPQACLSLAAPQTRHRPVHGRHPHHWCPRPRATVDQLCCGCTDRGVSGLARHGGGGQEQRCQDLDGDHLRVVDNTLGPNTGRVLVLAGGLAVQLARLALGPQVALRQDLTASRPAPGRSALGPAQLGCASFAVPEVGQVIAEVGDGGRGGHTPVDNDRPAGFGSELDLAAGHKRGVPVPKAGLVDAEAGQGAGQLPGPGDGDAHPTRQKQPTATKRETPGGCTHLARTIKDTSAWPFRGEFCVLRSLLPTPRTNPYIRRHRRRPNTGGRQTHVENHHVTTATPLPPHG